MVNLYSPYAKKGNTKPMQIKHHPMAAGGGRLGGGGAGPGAGGLGLFDALSIKKPQMQKIKATNGDK